MKRLRMCTTLIGLFFLLSMNSCHSIGSSQYQSASYYPAGGEYVALMEQAINTNDAQESITLYDKAIKLEPQKPLPYFNRAGMLAVLGELDRATADYETALQLGENDATAYLVCGRAYLAKRNYEKALNKFDSAFGLADNIGLKNTIQFGRIDAFRGMIRRENDPAVKNGYLTKALDTVDGMIIRMPEEMSIKLLRPRLLADAGKTGAALEEINHMVHGFPGNPMPWLLRAKIRYYELEHTEDNLSLVLADLGKVEQTDKKLMKA